MARSVTDAATILFVIAGQDPLDNFTLIQPQPVPDYRDALNSHALRGVRLGVPRKFQGTDENIIAAFNASIEVIRNLGAVVVDPAEFPDADELFASNNETIVLSTDFKVDNNGQLQKRLLIMTFIIGRFEQVHYQSRESSYGHKESGRYHHLQHQTCKRGTHTAILYRPISVITGHALSVIKQVANANNRLIASEATTINDAYFTALAANKDLGRTRGIDATLDEFNLDAILLPTDGKSSTHPRCH